MLRRIIISGVMVALLIGLGVGLFRWLVKTAVRPPEVALLRPPLVVQAVRVEPTTVVEPIIGYGTARPDRVAQLSAQVSGEIVALADDLKVGSAFEAGAVLVRIDDREYQQQLARIEGLLAGDKAQLAERDVEEANLTRLIETAQRELDSTEWEFNKVSQLYNDGAAPKREYEQMRLLVERARRTVQVLENSKAVLPAQRAQLEAARQTHQAEADIAHLNLDRCTVRAPFAGEVADKRVEVGERVQSGGPLLTLLDPRRIEVPVELPVSVRSRVAVGRKCRIQPTGRSESVWEGRVKRIAPAANEATRTFGLFLEVDNATQAEPLVPGFFVRAAIDGETLDNVLVVPRESIQRGRVFVYGQGKAQARAVEVVRHLRERSVVAGLEPGDIVIVSHMSALFEGAPVRLENAEALGVEPAEKVIASRAEPSGELDSNAPGPVGGP